MLAETAQTTCAVARWRRRLGHPYGRWLCFDTRSAAEAIGRLLRCWLPPSRRLIVPLWVRGPGEVPVLARGDPTSTNAAARVAFAAARRRFRGFVLYEPRRASSELEPDRARRWPDLATLRPRRPIRVTAAVTAPAEKRRDPTTSIVGAEEERSIWPDYCFAQARCTRIRSGGAAVIDRFAPRPSGMCPTTMAMVGVVNWLLTARNRVGYLRCS
jgi:hypothetical protein